MPPTSNEQSNLLPSDARLSARAEPSPSRPHHEAAATLYAARGRTRDFLTSKAGHYAVLALVSLDVGCIFADFLISLYVCEQSCGNRSAGDAASLEALRKTQEVLAIISLIFSCSFVAELLASVWAFGLTFFKSKFHVFDAVIILASFILEVCLRGVLEEVGAVVVVLRLFRVVKIIDEFSAGAEERMDAVSERVEAVERENKGLQKEKHGLREERDELLEERNSLRLEQQAWTKDKDCMRQEVDVLLRDRDSLRQELDGIGIEMDGMRDLMNGLKKEKDALDWELKTTRRFQGLGR